MKTCPACRRQFDNDTMFCLDDGTPLAGDTAAANITGLPTEEYRGDNFSLPGTSGHPTAEMIRGENVAQIRPAASSGSGFTFLIVAVVFITGIFVILAAGIGGFWYYTSKTGDIAAGNFSGANKGGSGIENGRSTPSDSNSVDGSAPFPEIAPPVNKPPPRPTLEPGKASEIEPPPRISGPPPLRVEPSPQTKPTPPPPKTISGGVLNGKAISLPRPPYPPAARAVRASGAVSVLVTVDENGRVISASAVSGHPLLRAAAVSAARSAVFSVTRLSGQSVKVTGIIVYNFVP